MAVRDSREPDSASFVLHPGLEVRFESRHGRYLDYFRNEYDRVAVEGPAPDRVVLTVRIGRRLPEPQAGDRLRNVVFKRLLRFQYVVRGLDTDHVDIYVRDLLPAHAYGKLLTLFLQAQVVEPVIYLKLLERGVLFMHAAGVSDGQAGYLFPAHGGTGKTTLTLGLMAEGMAVLGDDLLIVDPGTGLVHPYLRPLHVFTYNVRSLRGATIPHGVRAAVWVKDKLRVILERVLRDEFLFSTRVHAETLYPDFRAGTAVPYRKILFLTKEGDRVSTAVSDDNLDRLVELIRESADLNISLYANILDQGEAARGVTLERKVIRDVLSRVSALDSVNTRRLDFNDLRAFKSALTGALA
jgi:hypothetical protein